MATKATTKAATKPATEESKKQRYPGMSFVRQGFAACIVQYTVVSKESRKDGKTAILHAVVVKSVEIQKSMAIAKAKLKALNDPDRYVQEIWIEDHSRG